MLRNLLALFLVLLYLSSFKIYGQYNEDQYYQAEDLLEDGNYHKALENFQYLLGLSPNNANLNFKIGFCYLQTATEKVKSISYLEFASKRIVDDYNGGSHLETGAPIETLFYLGMAYHVNYRFDDAERTFFALKEKISKEEVDFIEKINHELLACQSARILIKNPVEMTVSNLGQSVNSTFSEHSPVISGDESILIFTSKREENTGDNRMDDGQYFEDIYISSFNGKVYSKAKNISNNINTSGHEASIGLSFDGSKLFIYRDDEGDGNIYMSTRKGAEWMVPEKLSANINSKYRETHASMSFDQNQIFFTSDRKGGYGGLDIYRVRKLPNGNWSKAQNLGPQINTKYDEEGPYFHPDGSSLFFASQGHNTMGGFDIFVSTLSETDKWSTPQNVGYPINTPDDNIYYVPSVDGRRAYYSSYANNSIGNYDIFRIDLAESHIRNQTVIAGYAYSPDGEPLVDAIITITDMDDEIIGIYTPDPETNKFLFILPRGRTFNAYFESSNYDDFEFTINVPEYAYDQSKQVVVFNQIATIVVKDAPLVFAMDIDAETEDIESSDDVQDIVDDKKIGLNVIVSDEIAENSKINYSNQAENDEVNRLEAEKIEAQKLLVSSELNMNETINEGEKGIKDNKSAEIDYKESFYKDKKIKEEGEIIEAVSEKDKNKRGIYKKDNEGINEVNNNIWYWLAGIASLLVVIGVARKFFKQNT